MKKLLLALIFLFYSYAVCAQQPEFSASVDRQQIYPGQSLQLTLQLRPAQSLLEPNISGLKQEFKLLGSRHEYLQQDGQSIRQWVFRISPKKPRDSLIPAISLGQLSSSAIAIRVLEQPELHGHQNQDFFIQASLDKQQVYLHEQSILQLRIFHAPPLFGAASLQHLEMPNARVEQLGQPSHDQQIIDGRHYAVMQTSYAIYPLQSGTIEIPAIRFSATPIKDDPRLLQNGIIEADTAVHISSQPLQLKVLPPPAAFPETASWLPASSLQIKQQWSPDNAAATSTEQAISRTLQLEAQGLPASLLPEILPARQQHFQVFPSAVLHSQHSSGKGISSQQIEQQALVANEPGSFLLEAMRIPWWNTSSDQLEYIELPEQLIQVRAPALTRIIDANNSLYIWQLLSLLLALGNLVFFLLWHLGKRRTPRYPSGGNARLLENLRRACKNNNPLQARNAIDALARQASMTPSDAARLSPQFAHALDELNGVLYTDSAAQHWHGEKLWNAVSQLIKFNSSPDNDSLPPLYPP